MYGLLNQTVTIAAKTSLDNYGEPVWGTGVSAQARVELRERRRYTPNKETITTAGKVMLRPETTIDSNSKITYQGIDYRVYTISTATGGDGSAHHLSVEIQKWHP